MIPTRRIFTLGLAATALSGCVGNRALTPAPQTTRDPAFQPTPNAGWDAWVASFKGRASAQGISQATLDTAFRGAGFLPGVIERDRNQTEFKRSLEDYLSIAASDERVAKGRANFARYRGVLSEVENRYGVDANVVTAVWGLESFYGERRGDIQVVSAVSTLSYDGRRGDFFEKQLLAALRILQNGDVSAANMTGSWAGAMGHTQFIPTSYQGYAVDFRGDGRRDIWSDDPTDGLASTANYLAKSGWRRGQPWGGERGSAGANVGGRTLQPDPGGPVFTVGQNFNVIKRYNNSDAYAIGVGHLADRIAGGGPLNASFGPDANGLTKEDRQRLQRRLTARGFDTGGDDGVIGPKSRTAIAGYQSSIGQAATGVPSPALLSSLG